MNTKKKKILIISVIIAGLLAAGILMLCKMTGEEAYRLIQVVEVAGDVEMNRENIGKSQLQADTNLQNGDKVAVKEQAYTRMALDEDKYVYAEENTKFELEAEGDAVDSKTRILLSQGAITTEIQKPLTDHSSFEVTTPNSTMSVRGTVYRVSLEYDENGESFTKLEVFEGEVATQLVRPDGTVSDKELVVGAGKGIRAHGNAKESEYILADGTKVKENQIEKVAAEAEEKLFFDVEIEELPEQALKSLLTISEHQEKELPYTKTELEEALEVAEEEKRSEEALALSEKKEEEKKEVSKETMPERPREEILPSLPPVVAERPELPVLPSIPQEVIPTPTPDPKPEKVSYRVVHKFENPQGNEYNYVIDGSQTATYEGVPGGYTIKPQPLKSLPAGYSYDAGRSDQQPKVIAKDGTTVLELCYTLERYTVTWVNDNKTGATAVGHSTTNVYRHGEKLGNLEKMKNASTDAEANGFIEGCESVWLGQEGWSPEARVYTEEDVVAKDMTFYETVLVPYTVELYYQDLRESKFVYDLHKTVTGKRPTGEYDVRNGDITDRADVENFPAVDEVPLAGGGKYESVWVQKIDPKQENIYRTYYERALYKVRYFDVNGKYLGDSGVDSQFYDHLWLASLREPATPNAKWYLRMPDGGKGEEFIPGKIVTRGVKVGEDYYMDVQEYVD